MIVQEFILEKLKYINTNFEIWEWKLYLFKNKNITENILLKSKDI